MTPRRFPTFLVLCLLLMVFLVLSPFRPVSARSQFSLPLQDAQPTDTPRASPPTPADIINAVNNLRLARGLNALTTNAILMQVAAYQANALARSAGAVGHMRPCGMTLGQELLARGYPLLGDLSLDGYRSENWVAAPTTADAINFWLSDDLHTNTMLSPDRSDIGAAVSSSDQIYIVLETAMSTGSGQMQYDAYPIQTGIPMTQAACNGMYTQAAQSGAPDQYAIPVAISTALPNGDVIHEVQYGQALWTLAIQYKTTIAEIKRLNHLASDTISPGMKLIVKTGATQPGSGMEAPAAITITSTARAFAFVVTPAPASPTALPIAHAGQPSANQFLHENSLVIAALIIAFSVLLAGLGVVGKRKA